MKTWFTIALSATGALCVMFFLTACPGKGTSATIDATCSMGYVSTGYGCLPQGNCPLGQGYYATQNTCVAGTIGGGYGSYMAWTGYSTSLINSYAYNDFLFRISGCVDNGAAGFIFYGGNLCSYYGQNMSVSLQTVATTVPTQAVLTVIVGNYYAQAVIQGTVVAINGNSGVQFNGTYGVMQVGLRVPSQTLAVSNLTSYLSNNGQDFANVTLNRAY